MSKSNKTEQLEVISRDLAAKAKIQPEEALRVLEVLGIESLLSDVVAVNRVVSSNSASRSLGIDRDVKTLEHINLNHLRIGLNGSKFNYIDVCA